MVWFNLRVGNWKEGDIVKVTGRNDYRLNNRVGVIKEIIRLSEKSEKSALTKYDIEFLDKKYKSVGGEFIRNELKLVKRGKN